MKCRISSVIEVTTWGCDMQRKDKVSKRKHKEREESVSNTNRFFKHVATDNQGVRQEVNVTVNVEQPKDDCLTSCFSALGACFGKGAKGAAS